MKIVTGAYQRDAGEIFVDGAPVPSRARTRAAISASK